MNIKNFDCGYPYIIVDDFYDKNELDLIWREINFLLDGNNLSPPEKTSSAKDLNGEVKKKNKGIFVTPSFVRRKYRNPNYSNILKSNKKIFNNFSKMVSDNPSWFFTSLGSTPSILGKCGTLLSYYEGDDYYKSHWDVSLITMCIWLYKEPKKFDGGDFILNAKLDKDHGLNKSCQSQTIKLKNNRMVMFPGFIPHAVTPLKMDKEFKGMGRFTITNFLHPIST